MDNLQTQDIPTLVLLGSLGMLLLIGSIALFVLMYQKRVLREKEKEIQREMEYQDTMMKLLFESQEQERTRIGADLHDSLGSLLWGAKVNASVIQRSIALNNSALVSYQELNQLIDESIDVVRRIAWELTPQAFEDLGLSESITRLCERLNGKGFTITFEEKGSKLWNDHRALQVFRIIQELVSNSIKHSSASSIFIALTWNDLELRATISDNGSGFQSSLPSKGVGLWNIKQRVKQLRGKYSIGIPPTGSGVEVQLDVPLVT
jgi:signal transduction histidine kinase